MALFPAYSGKCAESCNDNDSKSDQSWLSNSSFIKFSASQPEPPTNTSEDESSDEEEILMKRSDTVRAKRPSSPEEHKSKKTKHKKSECLDSVVNDELLKGLEDLCFVDITPLPAADLLPPKLKKAKKKKKKMYSKERYFSKFKPIKDCLSETKLLDEEELRKNTEEFNIALREDSSNIDLWLEYVRFQDKVIKEKMARVDKQLSIIEKALKENPGCSKLYNEMFSLMYSVQSVDTVAAAARKASAEDGRNIAAWQWQVNCAMYNVGRLNAPSVIETYGRALDALFRAYPSSSVPLVDMLLQLCTFLRQAGLWEQLWLIVELSMELNLSSPDSHVFRVDTVIQEDRINKLEEEIVTCGLPVGVLWLRTEHLRDSVHFLPVEDAQGDEQRIVHSSDVSHLVHPVRCVPRLITVFLSSLKVPMIPGSHCAAIYLGIDKISWAFESSESLLAVLVHPYIRVRDEETCLSALREMVTGPQYLVMGKPGAREFFQSIAFLFEVAIRTGTSILSEDVVTPVAVWFIRWLMFVGDKSSASRAKKLLKDHRDCIPVYTEYALFMQSLGDTSTCIKVMDAAVAQTQSPLYVGKKSDKHYITYLYRSYVELLYRLDAKGNREKIANLLARMIGSKTDLTGDELLKHICTKFEHINSELIKETIDEIKAAEDMHLAEVVLGIPLVSWLACQTVAVRLLQSPWNAAEVIKTALGHISPLIDRSCLSLGLAVEEGLYEILVHIIHSACPVPDNYPALKVALKEAIAAFPYNLYFLYIAASVDVILGKWWSVSPVFFGNSVYLKIFTILIHRLKMFDHSNASGEERNAAANRVVAVARAAVAGDQCERNPLLWRLLLQCAQVLTPGEGRSAFLRAIDACPWAKSIYYDAAKILPEEMGHIQDLLIEKELRVHITLEELEILRQSSA